MSVKREESGRRSIQAEVEVPLTPEEVWETIATGPGLRCWFMAMDMDMEQKEGGSITVDMGEGKVPIGTVLAWNPPHRFVGEGQNFGPDGPTVATEWNVEARSGGRCVIRVVHSLFAETDDWDGELENLENGWPRFFRILRLYLTHFRGQKGAIASVMLPTSATVDEAWSTVASALGVAAVSAGQRWSSRGSGAPQLAGVVDEAVHVAPHRAIVVLDEPGPAILFCGAVAMQGVPTAHLSVYHYGDDADEVAQREQPKWQAWLQGLLPAVS